MTNTPTVLTVGTAEARDAFTGQVDRFVRAVEGLDDFALLAASRCHGWSVLDVVVHVRIGLEEMLRGVAAPTPEVPTVDAATYWSACAAAENPEARVDDILWVRRTAAAYRRPAVAVRHLRSAADAITAAHLPAGALRFQGYVLTVGDFLATWAVELAVHHVDLDLGAPSPASLSLTRATIEALLGEPVAATVSDLDVLLIGSGRVAAPQGLDRVQPGFDRVRPVLG